MDRKYRQKLKLLRDLARALRLHRKFASLEHGTREALQAYQNEQFERVVRHAMEHSPFYRELCRNIDVSRGIRLRDLPIVDKRLMMQNFDRWVTDPRLKLAAIERQIEADPEDQYYLGEYRIVASSGSSGLRGIFVYDRSEWSVVIAASLRWAGMFGRGPIQMSREKIAVIIAEEPIHGSRRFVQDMSLPLRNLQWFHATMSVADIVTALNAYQPSILMGYASLISLLASEQTQGRLHIAPAVVTTISELLGDDRIGRVREAWGVTPFNHYGAAEAFMIAAECSEHKGLHHFADMSIVEVVDEQYQPVRPGTPGHKILLTNLHKFVQPVIRYEITDLVTEAVAPCSCGRSLPLFAQIGGRSEDIIYLPGEGATSVPVSPLIVASCLDGIGDIVEYQYSFSDNTMSLRVVPRTGAAQQTLADGIRRALTGIFASQGATKFAIEITFVDHLVRPRSTMGKLKLVESQP